MVSDQLLNAIMERLIEQTKKKHPGEDIFKKQPWKCNYPNCDGGSATGYCHVKCRPPKRRKKDAN